MQILNGFVSIEVLGGDFAPSEFQTGVGANQGDGSGGTLSAQSIGGFGGNVLGHIQIDGSIAVVEADGGNLSADLEAGAVGVLRATINDSLTEGGNVTGTIDVASINQLTTLGGSISSTLTTHDVSHTSFRADAVPISVKGVTIDSRNSFHIAGGVQRVTGNQVSLRVEAGGEIGTVSVTLFQDALPPRLHADLTAQRLDQIVVTSGDVRLDVNTTAEAWQLGGQPVVDRLQVPDTAAGNTQINSNPGSATTEITQYTPVDILPPTVTRVIVGSSTGAADDWSSAFIGLVDTDGIGYPIPHGPGQLNPLPWGNIRQIFIEFSEDIGQLDTSYVRLLGANTADDTVQIIAVSYDSRSNRAIVTMNTPLRADELLLVVSDSVTDLAGNRLDGDWIDGTSLGASGDTLRGGDFQFRLHVLPGDVNQSGGVDVNDLGPVRSGLGSSVGLPGYSIFADLIGSGAVAVNHVGPLRANLGSHLPAGSVTPLSAVSAMQLNGPPDLIDVALSDLLSTRNSPSDDNPSAQPWLIP